AVAFFIGSALAGLGGVFGGTMLSLAPGQDQAFLISSLIVVLVGGMGSLKGAVLGALLLGLVEQYGRAYLPTAYANLSILLTFLSGYGGMVSLAQTGLFGVAGLVSAKLAVTMGWNVWLAALAGIAVATAVGLLFGALASGSRGIYFLVITLAFGEITYSYFAAVNTFGAHEGINGDLPPAILGNPVLHPARMYYFTLVVCVLVYLALRYVARTPFGIALQGIRDDPVRMSALGYNVRLHRTLGFALAAPVAGLA